jgi:hypothetical protein
LPFWAAAHYSTSALVGALLAAWGQLQRQVLAGTAESVLLLLAIVLLPLRP